MPSLEEKYNHYLQQALAISTVMSVSHKGNSPRRLFRQQHLRWDERKQKNQADQASINRCIVQNPKL